MTVKEFISAGYITDVSIASKLITGELKMTDDIVRNNVTHKGAYEEFFRELENTTEETTKVILTINYSSGDVVVKLLPTNKTIETEGHYVFVEEDLAAPAMTKKQLTTLEGKEFVGYTYNGTEVKVGDSIDITEDTTIELIALFA